MGAPGAWGRRAHGGVGRMGVSGAWVRRALGFGWLTSRGSCWRPRHKQPPAPGPGVATRQPALRLCGSGATRSSGWRPSAPAPSYKATRPRRSPPVILRSTTASRPWSSPSSSCCSQPGLHAALQTAAPPGSGTRCTTLSLAVDTTIKPGGGQAGGEAGAAGVGPDAVGARSRASAPSTRMQPSVRTRAKRTAVCVAAAPPPWPPARAAAHLRLGCPLRPAHRRPAVGTLCAPRLHRAAGCTSARRA
jgi:hypothetical protein